MDEYWIKESLKNTVDEMDQLMDDVETKMEDTKLGEEIWEALDDIKLGVRLMIEEIGKKQNRN